MLRELIRKNRCYRRFFEEERIDRALLEELIENARFSSSMGNIQPLKFVLVDSHGPREAIFPCLKWAGYLPDWPGPVEGERPAAYLVILHDTAIPMKTEYLWCDVGLYTQHIMMSASERGYGGCIIGTMDRAALRSVLRLSERYEIMLALALGKPKERVVLTDVGASGDIKYYRDGEGTHFVPKRSLGELIVS